MTKIQKLAIAAAVMAAVAPAQAQSLKSENARLRAENEALKAELGKHKKAETPKNTWVRQLSAGLILTDGNNDTLTVTGGLSLDREGESSKSRVFVNGAYGETNSAQTTQFIRAGASHSEDFSQFAYWYAALGMEHDDVAALDFRLSVGPGVGYHLYKTDTIELNIEGGLAYYFEKYQFATTTDESTIRFRAAENFTYKFAPGAKFYQTFEYAADIAEPENYIVNFEAGVESTLTDNLKLRLSFLDRYVAEPPAGLENNDIQVTSSLVIGF